MSPPSASDGSPFQAHFQNAGMTRLIRVRACFAASLIPRWDHHNSHDVWLWYLYIGFIRKLTSRGIPVFVPK